ncbi:UNVERIFIED_CONTAM: hypothetical protein K2H54_042381 [Gekko kuhli]
MRKIEGKKTKLLPSTSRSIKEHFGTEKNRSSPMPKENKMAAAKTVMELNPTLAMESPILDYLKTMEAGLQDRISTLTSHVEDIKLSLSQAMEKADTALENSQTNTENIKLLHENMLTVNDKLMAVETEQKASNLKFRGFPEEAEGTEDLISFIATFIACALKLEEGIYPIITFAARIGSKNNVRCKTPRDILATIPDLRVRRRILQEAQKANIFVHDDQQIDIFPDIPKDALQIRRSLKTTTKQLQAIHQKYRWLPSGKLYVFYKGQHLYAHDEESGKQLLEFMPGADKRQNVKL